MKTGKYILIALFLVTLVIDITSLIFYLGAENTQKGISTTVRIVLGVGLFYAVYQGKNWARILTIILLSLACALLTIGVITTMHPLLIGTLLYMAFFIYALTILQPVRDFLNRNLR